LSQLHKTSNDGVEAVRQLCLLNENFSHEPEAFIHLDDESFNGTRHGDTVDFVQEDISCDEEEASVGT